MADHTIFTHIEDDGDMYSFLEDCTEIRRPIILKWEIKGCPPCKAIMPHFKNLARRMKDIDFAVANANDCSDYALDWNVRRFPTFLLIFNQEVVKRLIGADQAGLTKLAKFASENYSASE